MGHRPSISLGSDLSMLHLAVLPLGVTLLEDAALESDMVSSGEDLVRG